MTISSGPSEVPPFAFKKDISRDYVPRLQMLLREIDYRYLAPPSPSTAFFHSHHSWIHNTVGPMTSWTKSQLDALEVASSTFQERSYPSADIEIKTIMAKLTALFLFIDDSLENDATGIYDELGSFAHNIYIGKSQPSGILELYHECIKEMSHLCEGDPVLRGLAVVPWINFVDACLLEKRLLTIAPELRASPYDMGYQNIAKQEYLGGSHVPARNVSPGASMHFPIYLRHRTGVGEAYAAVVFKATKEQGLPLSRYITALPDMSLYIVLLNDLLSFHKEELAGETINMIHIRTQTLKENSGTGASGEWTVFDTFSLMCEEAKEAAYRIDEILRLYDCERIVRDGLDSGDMGLSEVDVAIALQWRGFRDGYISWHLEAQRYKLDFIRPEQFKLN
ncbi:terpenoid synthase [Rhodocollybia butyracea]|uniref:Terpenoid synthase n=1 Tax=Rhodocollybia butyracea TaxID=206335 RepID=A0A9P5PP52_9AGAR|nr:terpenoid synthase [Rhodocollybia butyracea]